MKPTLSDRFRYRIDTIFSRGAGAMIASLAVLSIMLILFAALIISVAGFARDGKTPVTFWEASWESLTRAINGSTISGDVGYRSVMFIVTLGGVFFVSILIGVLSNWIRSRLDTLRKGRSRVLESGHTVILGWSQQVYTIVRELVEANKSLKNPCIVILGEEEKPEMEDALRQQVGSFANTRIVCRHGSPVEMGDLDIVSLNTARAIIVLSPDSDDPDSEVIKTILAITNHPSRGLSESKTPARLHIVAEMRSPHNQQIAAVVGKDEVEWVQVGDVIARVIAQTCRQSGLSVVYNELLDFGGDEIYFYSHPSLVGRPFGETLALFEKNTVLGLASPAGVALNPPMDTPVGAQDQLVVIAGDETDIHLDGRQPPPVDAAQIVAGPAPTPGPERTLILGWNWRGAAIIRELDAYVSPGSEALVVAEHDGLSDAIDACRVALSNQSVVCQPGDITDRRLLDGLEINRYQHIILLCYSDTLTAQQADSRTLVTLLHLRDIAEKTNKNFSIVSEMLDVRNRNLADITRADDFIVSDRLISLLMAQVSENKALNPVFQDLFDPEGSEVYLKPARYYVETGAPVNFYTVVEAARRRGEIAIGYRVAARALESPAYGVVLNPRKSEEIIFGQHDRLVLLAER